MQQEAESRIIYAVTLCTISSRM